METVKIDSFNNLWSGFNECEFCAALKCNVSPCCTRLCHSCRKKFISGCSELQSGRQFLSKQHLMWNWVLLQR